MHKAWQKNEGFTLIEIMVVVVILGILTALVLPRVIGDVRTTAVDNRSAANLRNLQAALDRAKLDTDATAINLADLVYSTAPSGVDSTKWKGPYVAEIPTKPDGSDYVIIPGGVVQ